jgi:hypothetical protein
MSRTCGITCWWRRSTDPRWLSRDYFPNNLQSFSAFC